MTTTQISPGAQGESQSKQPVRGPTLGYCRTCGWPVAPEGCALLPEHDTPREGAEAERCSDTACEVAASATTYVVQAIDSEDPSGWMDADGVVSVRPGEQDSGRVNYRVVTTDPEALEAALDADDDVLRYEEVES